MSHTTFDALPPTSRIWVFVAEEPLDAAAEGLLRQACEKFLRIWKTKEEQIRGCYEIRDGRFLLVGADESAAPLSGCSVDAMMARILMLEEEAGVKLVDRTRVYWRDASGKVHAHTRPEFRKLLERGEVGPDTPVLDTTLSRIEQLREGKFCVPMKDCWHAKLFLPQVASSS